MLTWETVVIINSCLYILISFIKYTVFNILDQRGQFETKKGYKIQIAFEAISVVFLVIILITCVYTNPQVEGAMTFVAFIGVLLGISIEYLIKVYCDYKKAIEA